MNLALSPLLVEKQTLLMAKKTMTLAKRAAVKGDLRLGVSRAITAVIQASIVAACTGQRMTKIYADQVIQEARELIMKIVVVRARVRKLG